MGFYLRKSIRVGPLRFNLSKSGIGVSAGIKGLRVGFGPRGNYIHASNGGFQYQTTLTPRAHKNQQLTPANPAVALPRDGTMQEIASDMAMLLTASSEDELVAELNQKLPKFNLWKWVAPLGVGLGIYGHPMLFLAAMIFVPFVFLLDEMRRSVVLFYDFDEDTQRRFESVVNEYGAPMKAKRIWHLEASAEVKDWKRHSGASREFRRKATAASLRPPRVIKVNIPVPTLRVGKETLCFLPDRLLIISPNRAATVKYSELQIEIVLSRFIESEGVPSDSQVIDYTWQYVNKKGGPDKRFKNNRQFPICAYDAVGFSSASGLNSMIQVSKRGQFERFRELIQDLSRQAA